MSIRPIVLAINEAFTRLMPDPETINVGSKENDRTGDEGVAGFTKILNNVERAIKRNQVLDVLLREINGCTNEGCAHCKALAEKAETALKQL